MMLVCVFLVMMLAMLGATFRQMATALRVETYRSGQVQRRQAFEGLGSRWVASQVLTSFENSGGPDINPPPSSMPGPDGTSTYSVNYSQSTDPVTGTTFWVVTINSL